MLRHVMSIRVLEERFEMNDMSCPWCEADLVLRVISDEQTCAECGTSWSYEDETADELPLAA
jgi:transposase-like protein